MWIFYSVISLLSSTVRRIYDKHLTTHFGNFSMAFAMNVFSLLPMAVFLFFFPIPKDIAHLGWYFWGPMLINCLAIYPAQVYLYVRAIREGELSSVVPLMAITPLFNVVTSFVLIREIPTALGFMGILIIVAGVYLLMKKKEAHLKIRPELLMALSMFGLAIGATFDKIAIGVSTPMFYSFVNTLISSIVLFICVHIAGERKQIQKMGTMFRPLFLLGVLVAISFCSLEIAFSYGPTSYVLAIRTGSIVLASLWGIWKLKEEFSFRKLFAIACFIGGTLLLVFA